ncbi:hypothetical protein ACFH04_25855 [Streptomyces noboritoensis]|uniref:Nucleotide exchange factor GrpE n=1 Tax=Streptomyces noboritoensis TaxID=67337 RepID=A0ABV6TMV3_9ACTN
MSELDTFPPVPAEEPPLPQEPDDAAETETDRLRAEVADLRRERDAWERQDAVDGLLQRFQYMTPEIVQALGDDIPLDRLEAVAKAVNGAVHGGRYPRGLGRGGLDPTGGDRQDVTWDRLFSQARHNRTQGQGTTSVGDLR